MVRVPLERLLQEQPLYCVDGRKPACVIAAPGGNAGEFLLLLGALEQYTGAAVKREEVHRLFGAYLDRFGRFYMHTDRHALAHLQEALQHAPPAAPLIDRPASTEAVEAMIRWPPEAAVPLLLELLAQPAHVGCGHLRLLLQHEAEYGVRPALAAHFFEAFFQALWRGDPRPTYDVLAGEHAERAVVNVLNAPGDGDEAPALLHCPRYREMQVFVHHPQALTFLRAQHARFLAESPLTPLTPADETAFTRGLQRLAARQLEATLRHLASGLPIFQVQPTPSGFAVREICPAAVSV